MVTYFSVLVIRLGLSTNYDKIYGYVDIYVNLLIVSKQLYHTICIYEGIFSYIIRERLAKIKDPAAWAFHSKSLARNRILADGLHQKV